MRRALVIGIDNYPQCPLQGCINDAECISKQLSRNEDHSINFEVMEVYDSITTSKAKSLISDLFKGDGDTALFYFAGHGHYSENGHYIVFPDNVARGELEQGIELNYIINKANLSRFRNKVIILDSCFSGGIGNLPNRKVDSCEIAQGVSILTACRKDEPSEESCCHGVFTEQLCNALDGGAADFCGNITIGGIYAYIDRNFGAWQQRPAFKTNVTAFAPIKKVHPPIRIDIIRNLVIYFKSRNDVYHLDPSYEYTNIRGVENSIEPYADESKVKIFKELQKLESIGLVCPLEEEHMYYAAMNSKGCKLTKMGQYYWNLANNNRI